MEVGIVQDGVIDRLGDGFEGVMIQAEDGGAQDMNSVRLEAAHQRDRVNAMKLPVWIVFALQTQPDPGNSQCDQFLDRIGANGVRIAEDVQRPCLVVLLHQVQ
jgi:hypothetical protein